MEYMIDIHTVGFPAMERPSLQLYLLTWSSMNKQSKF